MVVIFLFVTFISFCKYFFILLDITITSFTPLYVIFNKNLKKLKELEKYTLDFSRSSFLVLLFSVEFFVLFSVQYFIVLLSLKEYQLLIYGLFLSSVFVAWWYAKREKKKYEENSKRFYEIYEDSLNILFTLEKNGCIKRDELYIKESIEHI